MAPPTVWLIHTADPRWADEASLAADERARADRFRVEGARRRFVATRVALRHHLGAHLGVPAAALRLGPSTCPTCGGRHGKPELQPPLSGRAHLSVSHSGDLALVAIDTGGPVGVDVQQVSVRTKVDRLARRYFTEREQEFLAGLPAERRAEGFTRLWCRKEAYLKGTGRGLPGGVGSVEVPGWTWAGPVRDRRHPDGRSWQVVDVEVPAGYCAAVAATGAGWRPEVIDDRAVPG